jgi:hypothetical protein
MGFLGLCSSPGFLLCVLSGKPASLLSHRFPKYQMKH